ncbi:MAG: methyltransferase [Vicinamibacterales bacterium]
MDGWLLLVAALALAPERIAYIWISRQPARFARLIERVRPAGHANPMRAVGHLFVGFKIVQACVIVGWLQWHAAGAFLRTVNVGWPAVLGGMLVAGGQYLNLRVFRLLGFDGVFYGNRFGLRLPRCEAFPFSAIAHPQYFGACLSIWGIFLLARFPHADWFAIPAIESVLYAVSARLER